jgi:hypothetical protein
MPAYAQSTYAGKVASAVEGRVGNGHRIEII